MGPMDHNESARRSRVTKAERKRRKATYYQEVSDFLLWLRHKPCAFVVFNKADLIALRKVA
jgi:hypothetical protein